MKPRNFPARRLLRQTIALPPSKFDQLMSEGPVFIEQMLDKARAVRTKKCRSSTR